MAKRRIEGEDAPVEVVGEFIRVPADPGTWAIVGVCLVSFAAVLGSMAAPWLRRRRERQRTRRRRGDWSE